MCGGELGICVCVGQSTVSWRSKQSQMSQKSLGGSFFFAGSLSWLQRRKGKAVQRSHGCSCWSRIGLIIGLTYHSYPVRQDYFHSVLRLPFSPIYPWASRSFSEGQRWLNSETQSVKVTQESSIRAEKPLFKNNQILSSHVNVVHRTKPGFTPLWVI